MDDMQQTTVIRLVTCGAALGCGLIAGVFFAFSTFVMPALASLPPRQGVAAMQAINVAVINRWFLGAFLGTGVACALVSVSALFAWDRPGAALRLGGGVLYLVGTLGVTMSFHVPRNDRLATVQPEAAEVATLWPTYVRGWTAGNSVRAAAALLAAASLLAAARVGSVRERSCAVHENATFG